MIATAWWDEYAERPWKGISSLVLDEAGVYCDSDGIVRVPYRNADGTLHREHLFAEDGRVWWSEGEGLIPFGLELLPDAKLASRSALIIAEGDSDALAIREAFAATTANNPIAGYYVLAVPGASTWRTEWREYVEPFDLVYGVGHGDPAGRRMLDTTCRDAPWLRGVLLPAGEDARSILQRDGARALDPFLDLADHRARLWTAWRVAGSVDEAERLLRGGLVTRVAA